MWIYFVEQVWTTSERDWNSHGWVTHETQRQFWENWHDQVTGSWVYEDCDWLEEGNDYLDY